MVGAAAPHFLQRGVDNIIYSIHAPGLPALLVPFYRVGQQYAARVDDTPGRYALHTDDNVFVEGRGFWVRGGRLAALHVLPAGASRLRVRVRNGGVGGPVAVELDGEREVVELTGGEVREFSTTLTGDEQLVAVSLFPANGFRPSDDGVSPDRRWLGCWVSIELEE